MKNDKEKAKEMPNNSNVNNIASYFPRDVLDEIDINDASKTKSLFKNSSSDKSMDKSIKSQANKNNNNKSDNSNGNNNNSNENNNLFHGIHHLVDLIKKFFCQKNFKINFLPIQKINHYFIKTYTSNKCLIFWNKKIFKII